MARRVLDNCRCSLSSFTCQLRLAWMPPSRLVFFFHFSQKEKNDNLCQTAAVLAVKTVRCGPLPLPPWTSLLDRWHYPIFFFYSGISLFWHRRLALCMKAEVRVNWISNQSHYYWWSSLYERAGAKSSMVAVSIVILKLVFWPRKSESKATGIG